MPHSSALKSPFSFDIVVATDSAGGIGRDGDMPWHLPGDLKFFAKLTTGDGNNVVIMGRKTWETIPDRYRPLPRRTNLVITRQEDYVAKDAITAPSFEQALLLAQENQANRVFVIGGAQIYRLALNHPSCRNLYITQIAHDFQCQVFFPPVQDYSCVEILGEGSDKKLAYRFTRWQDLTARAAAKHS